MTPKDAVQLVEKFDKKNRALKVSKYGENNYLVLREGSTPYCLVDKQSKIVVNINPMEDFDNIMDALENKVVLDVKAGASARYKQMF